MSRQATPRPRGFLLTIEPAGAVAFGLRLDETNGSATHASHAVARLGPKAAGRIVEQAMEALQAGGFRRSDLSAQRRRPFVLRDASGVRLALAMLASGPLIKPSRVEAVLAGVGRMSEEESYYWYAKCVGHDAPRARRALRLLLADT